MLKINGFPPVLQVNLNGSVALKVEVLSEYGLTSNFVINYELIDE